MFHVCTYLPFSPDDKQQLERKRHIGNDIVVIVFLENPEVSFVPKILISEMTNVICVISPENSTEVKRYRCAFAYKNGISISSPYLPYPGVFNIDNDFRNFLLTKLINNEISATCSSVFTEKLNKTRLMLLKDTLGLPIV